VKITIKNLQKTIPINPRRIKDIVLDVLAQEAAKKSGEINLCFITDKEIRKINFRYLGETQATDVLAFDLSDSKDRILADIFISADTAVSNAKIFKSTFFFEIYLYVIHAILHILGYDDQTDQDRSVIRAKEKKYLKKWLS
jgi:probable rRNA maturation factor